MKAVCLIREQPCYRRDAFVGGLRRAGYTLDTGGQPQAPTDLLVIWNRYGHYAQMADAWERSGGTVLVAENGYCGIDAQGRQRYALAAHGHNGSGWWPVGAEDRFAALGLEPQPWRTGGEYALVRGQRGIGTPQMASPPAWHVHTGARLRREQALPVRVIEHPGKSAVDANRSYDMRDAAACVIWSSALGVKALLVGVPVWFAAPHWVCEDGARRLADDWKLAAAQRDDAARALALQRMAHAQWAVDELESGEPFARFRDALHERKAA